jgi:UDP-glucose 4-epimerase
MKSIVTGGAGFIGSHIVDKLIQLGHEVIVIDNESSIFHENFYYNEKAKYYRIDISDYTGIRPLFEGVDYVFHLAAESRIQPAIENPLLCFNTNAYGTGVVLQCARESNVKKFIFSSTSSSYGLKNQPPLHEDMREDCLNPYSVSKIAGEKMCSMYTNLFGLKTIIFRYFNVYGNREPIRGSYAPVVGLFIRQKKSGQPLTIVGDGKQRRDFTHIDDVVMANILAIQVDAENYYGQVFNVGTGKNNSVLELASMISDNIVYVKSRLGEARETLANNEKIRKVFGWNPTTKIEDYIRSKLNESS